MCYGFLKHLAIHRFFCFSYQFPGVFIANILIVALELFGKQNQFQLEFFNLKEWFQYLFADKLLFKLNSMKSKLFAYYYSLFLSFFQYFYRNLYLKEKLFEINFY